MDRLPQLVRMVHEIAQITGLDWFVTEFMGAALTDDRDLQIVEPANALAHFGPGVRSLPEVPAEVTCIAAQRLVEVAWCHSRHLALADGITARLGISPRHKTICITRWWNGPRPARIMC